LQCCDEEIEINQLHERYQFESIENGSKDIAGVKLFSTYLQSLFNVEKCRKRDGKRIKTFYQGIGIRALPKLNNNNNCDFDQLTEFIAPTASIQHKTSDKFTCVFETNAFVNDAKVNKTLTFNQNKTWSLNINCKEVNLKKLEIDENFEFSKESIEQVCLIVQKMHLCTGIITNKACVVGPTQSLHNWNDGQNCGHSLRSNCCLHVVNFGSTNNICRPCQTMT